MNEIDIAAKAFFNRPFILADLCNSLIFNGEKAVAPEDVTPLPTELTGGTPDMGHEATPAASLRIRDSLNRVVYHTERRERTFDLGVEFQRRGNANCVIRSQDYDGRTLSVKIVVHRRVRGSRIIPVVTLTISLMDRPWRYPRSLRARFKGEDPRLLRFMNYSMNVVDPFTLDDKIIDHMCTELKTVLNCIRFSRDPDMLEKILTSIPGDSLSREAVHLLNVLLKLGLNIPEKKEVVKMCKAVREWRKRLINEGMEKGEKRGEKRGVTMGRQEGMAMGRQEGMAMGRQEGMAMGRQEGMATIIRSMLQRNASPEQIHQLTGLPLKQILDIASASLVTV